MATSTAAQKDAIQLLTADHKEVKTLFQQYQKLVDAEADDADKEALAQKICTMLTVHATVEEELFYPAAREALGEDDEDLVDEAAVEHASAKDLIAQIEGSSPDEPLYDAKVKVLGEYIDHHVKEEKNENFPKARSNRKLYLVARRDELMQRKEELMGEMA